MALLTVGETFLYVAELIVMLNVNHRS